MTLPSKTVVIRLPPQTAEKFRALCAEFGGLQPSKVLLCVVESVLNQSLPDQIEIVTTQIRKPGAKPTVQKKTSTRFESAILNKRHLRE